MIVRAQIELPLDPAEAFRTVLEELAAAGVTVEATEPCRQISFEWRPAPWEQTVTGVELRFVPAGNGTLVTIEHHGFEALLGDGRELAGWFAGQLAPPLLGEGLGDWLTDRRARRPSGAAAREVYRDPLYHRPGFKVLLGMLDLRPDDVLLEVGCGGGALLQEALESGCSALAVDHSAEMVGVAREQNREAVAAGRLKVIQATAVALPFAAGAATAAVMTGVLGFLTDPVVALREIRRVLRGGGRLALAGSDPELRGTPAAPEPMASRLRFYDDEGLNRLARDAGFNDIRVEHADLEGFAREAGVPEEHVPLFAGRGARFLLARR